MNIIKRIRVLCCGLLLLSGSGAISAIAAAADPLESDITLDGDIVVTPNPVLAGQEIVVRYRIKNQGAGATSTGFTTRVLLKNQYEFQFLSNDYLVPALAAGQVSQQEHRITLAGSLFSELIACV